MTHELQERVRVLLGMRYTHLFRYENRSMIPRSKARDLVEAIDKLLSDRDRPQHCIIDDEMIAASMLARGALMDAYESGEEATHKQIREWAEQCRVPTVDPETGANTIMVSTDFLIKLQQLVKEKT